MRNTSAIAVELACMLIVRRFCFLLQMRLFDLYSDVSCPCQEYYNVDLSWRCCS